MARAVRATLLAEEFRAAQQINEMEEYLGLLRQKKVIIGLRVMEADEQLGMVREALESKGIAEIEDPLSDVESFSSASSPPRSSDYICPDDFDTDPGSDYTPSALDSSNEFDHKTLGDRIVISKELKGRQVQVSEVTQEHKEMQSVE